MNLRASKRASLCTLSSLKEWKLENRPIIFAPIVTNKGKNLFFNANSLMLDASLCRCATGAALNTLSMAFGISRLEADQRGGRQGVLLARTVVWIAVLA